MSQLSLFEKRKELLEKFQSAFLLSAVGDSLGWPLEFRRNKPKKKIDSFFKWKKLVGGKWWGYEDEIAPGEYSDDTQLTLSVARSIKSNGEFDPTYFAYLELPFWLNYERGGGRSVKLASRNLLKKQTSWFTNFYKTENTNYFNAGANGAAMRNLPIALVNIDNEKRLIQDTIKNSLITHGHPRAIIGSLLIGAAQIHLLKNKSTEHLIEYIHYILDKANRIIKYSQDKDIANWLTEIKKRNNFDFSKRFNEYIEEAKEFTNKISDFLHKEDDDYYSFVKANDPLFKGSGVSTTCAAVYMFLKYLDHPAKSLINAVNFVGTDTDTIANFIGSLIGILLGMSVDSKLKNLQEQLQDKEYFLKIAENLFTIYTGDIKISEVTERIEKKESYLRILAWEIGLHELFWEALDEGDRIIHPVLGKGTIKNKVIKKIPTRNDYVVKVFKITFDCGQTAYFHSRVSTKNDIIQESLEKDVERILNI